MRKNALSQKGFTLIEVLISLAILATLGVMISQAISQGVKSKKKIQDQIDEVSALREAVKLMERDIQLAYHHRDWEKELQDLIQKKVTSNSNKSPNGAAANQGLSGTPGLSGVAGSPQTGQTQNTNEPQREVERLDPTTHFIGSDSELHFVTMNTSRMSRDSKQADFIEVGYALKDCKSADGKNTSKCLWRRTNKDVDDDPTKDGEEMVILENVTEFALKYIGRGKQDWVKDWKTKSTDDSTTKDTFPLAVEISITVQKKSEKLKSKKYSLQVVVPIHFPNNKEETSTNETSPK